MAMKKPIEERPGYGSLDEREVKVLRLILEGQTIRQISFQITCCDSTVRAYRDSILIKLGMEDLLELDAYSAHYSE